MRCITTLRRCAVHLAWVACVLSGCAVVAVVDTAATVAVKTVGLAADATIGTVRIAGRAVGAAANAALPGPTDAR
jgi:hypothetical protein